MNYYRETKRQTPIIKRFLPALILTSTVSGCYVNSSGTMAFGPDTYMITTKSELGGSGAAKKQALAEANEQCASKGKQMMPVSTQASTQRDFLGDLIPTFDFTFRCLSESDFELQRPNMKREADIIIENK